MQARLFTHPMQQPATATTMDSRLADSPPATPAPPAEPRTKSRVVVLGSGWGAVAFIKNVDPRMFGGEQGGWGVGGEQSRDGGGHRS